MSFNITFDYRLDTFGFFTPEARAALEEAASVWEAIIRDEFPGFRAGQTFTVRNPEGGDDVSVTLDRDVDDLLIFVGSRSLENALARGGADGSDVGGDVNNARISQDFRGQGPTTDYEPFIGTITFNRDSNWGFGIETAEPNKSDAVSIAIHEIGHVLGHSASQTYDSFVVDDVFRGPNALNLTGGQGIALEPLFGHVASGLEWGPSVMESSVAFGARTLPSDLDKAMLADIGYQIDGFAKQGMPFDLATNQGETIFGSVLADAIDALAGNDTIVAADGDDRILGGTGNDNLFAQNGDDIVFGGAGGDYLQGDAGNDHLRGGTGTDSIWGGEGADRIYVGIGDGQNRVSDFDFTSDRLVIDPAFGLTTAAQVLDLVTTPFPNVVEVVLPGQASAYLFHSENGMPLTAAHIDFGTLTDLPNLQGNTFQGSTERDVVVGAQGADTITGGRGDDEIFAGDGTDTAVFGTAQNGFAVRMFQDGQLEVRDKSGPLGTDTLHDVEVLSFSTSAVDLDEFSSAADLDAGAFLELAEMYAGYFNRAPDAVGLYFWADKLAEGLSLSRIADLFADQPETRAIFGTETQAEAIVTSVYENLLGRATDAAGFEFWTGQIASGETSQGQLILEVIRGAKAGTSAEDVAYLAQKTALGVEFAAVKGMSDAADAKQVFDVFADASTANLSGAMAAIDGHYADALDASQGDFLFELVGVSSGPVAEI